MHADSSCHMCESGGHTWYSISCMPQNLSEKPNPSLRMGSGNKNRDTLLIAITDIVHNFHNYTQSHNNEIIVMYYPWVARMKCKYSGTCHFDTYM